MSYMFKDSDVKMIDFSSSTFKADNVQTVEGMFNSCKYLSDIRFYQNFNVGKNANYMFKDTKSLKILEIGKLSSSENLQSMDGMFMNSPLEELKFDKGFKVENALSARNMLSGSNVKKIDMNNLNFKHLKVIDGMFPLNQVKRFAINGIPNDIKNDFLQSLANSAVNENVRFAIPNEYKDELEE